MEEITKIIQIPIWLKKCSQLEEKFLDYLISGQQRKIHVLQQLLQLLEFCDREPEEFEVVQLLIDAARRGEKPHPTDAKYILQLIENCRKDLENILSSEIELLQPLMMKRSDEMEAYKTMLKLIIGSHANKIESEKRELIKKFIYERPGEYIKSLTLRLRELYGREGLSYTNVSYHIKILEREKEIITIGGPQGRCKYCFPNPSKIINFKKYYHSPFAIEGIIKENVTKHFDTKKARRYYEIHLVSSNGKPNFLLVAGFGALSNFQNVFIKSYGELEPIDYIEKRYHIYMKSSAPAHIRESPTLLARKVVTIKNGREKNIWVISEELEDLSIPFTLP